MAGEQKTTGDVALKQRVPLNLRVRVSDNDVHINGDTASLQRLADAISTAIRRKGEDGTTMLMMHKSGTKGGTFPLFVIVMPDGN